MTQKKTDEGYPIFRSYLEEENDKPYYSMNTLSFYYEDMERKQELIETLAKKIVGYDLTLTDNLETIQREVEQRVNAWDDQVEQLPETVNDLLTDWVTSGTIDTIIEDARLNLKADKSEMDNRLELVDQQLAETVLKSDTGVLNLNVFDEPTRAAIQGLADGEINAVLGIGNVKPENTSFFTHLTKNLFNKETYSSGYVNGVHGGLTPSTSFHSSDFIDVVPGDVLKFSHGVAHYGLYEKDTTFINGESPSPAIKELMIPENTFKIRVSYYYTNTPVFMVAKNSLPATYEPFKIAIPSRFVESAPVTLESLPVIPGEKIEDNSIDQKKVTFLVRGKNMVDINKSTIGKYLTDTNGNLLDNESYSTTEHISVSAGEPLTLSRIRTAGFFNSEGTFISGVSVAAYPSNYTLTPPVNTATVRVSYKTEDAAIMQIEKGSIATEYEAFGYKLDKLIPPKQEVVDVSDEFLLFLPAEIPIAVGRTIELYNNQVSWTGNPDNYHFKWECAIGRAFERKWSCAATSGMVGSHLLTCTVFDNNMKEVAKKTTTVKIVEPSTLMPLKILNIGDSLSNKKAWYQEVDLLSGGDVSFVGSRLWEVDGKTYGHEGRSGFSAANYLTSAAYPYENEGVHPFWNPETSQFDYNYYKTQTNVEPDAVQVFLGTNGISLNPDANANNIKTIVDGIRAADATIPIYVVLTLFRGSQDGIGRQTSSDGYSAGSGVWKLEEDRKVFNLMVRLYELLSSYPNLKFIPVSLTHDSEYNFGEVQWKVNPRATRTEAGPTEATHPQTQGYLQMADIIFSAYVVG